MMENTKRDEKIVDVWSAGGGKEDKILGHEKNDKIPKLLAVKIMINEDRVLDVGQKIYTLCTKKKKKRKKNFELSGLRISVDFVFIFTLVARHVPQQL